MGLVFLLQVVAEARKRFGAVPKGLSALGILAVLALPGTGSAQVLTPAREYGIAARYAPDFHQMVNLRRPRLDLLTRYDFDNNWTADDNWVNVLNEEYRLPAYVYYAVSETRTHLFIHYVVFHPRDWKGPKYINGGLQAVKFVGRLLVFPRYLGLEIAAASHENDLEGVLVVVERNRPGSLEGKTVMVESHRHFRFRSLVRPEAAEKFKKKGDRKPLETRDERPVLYIESKGHGIQHYLRPKKKRGVIRYVYRGRAEEPEITAEGKWPEPVGYELLSLYGTLWQQAIKSPRKNRTFGRFQLYDKFELADFFPEGQRRVGTALQGRKRGRFRAIAPWGWHNNKVRGQWFFDPARNIAERYKPKGPFDLRYLSHRYLAGSHISPRDIPLEDGPAPSMD